MNSRELVLSAISHEETSRVPIGYNLKTDHELQLKAMHGWDPLEIKKRFKIDLQTVYLTPPANFIARAMKATVSTSFADSFLIDGKNGVYYDEWGVGYQIQKFPYRFVGTNNLVSLEISDIPKMVTHPISEMTLDALDKYLKNQFPNIHDESRYISMQQDIKINQKQPNPLAIEADMEMTLFEKAWYICGLPNFLGCLAKAHRKPNSEEAKFVNKILDAMLDFRLHQIEKYREVGGIDIIRFGDDVGMQTGLMFSVEIWRKFFKPRMNKLIEACHHDFHIYCHCDGNCTDLIPDFMEIGVEILNPIQPECMDPEKIKEKYGNKLTMYGVIGVQKPSLIDSRYPQVPQEEIARLSKLFCDEVKLRKRTLANGGGLILCPTNKIQADTYIESIEALYTELQKDTNIN